MGNNITGTREDFRGEMIKELPNEPKITHDLIEAYCRRVGKAFTSIKNPSGISDIAAQNGLIRFLSMEAFRPSRVATILGCDADYVRRVNKASHGHKVRTLDWDKVG